VKDPEFRDYAVVLQFLKDGFAYYFAYLPDFGLSACSAADDVVADVLIQLEEVYDYVIHLYGLKGLELPKPSTVAGYWVNAQS